MAQDDANRINGLMAAMGRKEQENKALRDQLEQLTAQEPDDGGLAAEPAVEQPATAWEPGTKLVVDDDGQLTALEPPQPYNPNETSRQAWDDRYPRAEASEPRTESGFPT